MEIEALDNDNVLAKAVETGNWRHFFKRNEKFDIRDLIGCELSIVTNEETIAKIDLQAGWM